MDRKGIAAIVLSLLVMVGWQFWNQKQLKDWQDAHPAEVAAAKAAAEAAANGSPTASPKAATPAPGITAAPVSPVGTKPGTEVPEHKQAVSTPSVIYNFTNRGGGIATAELLKHEGEMPGQHIVLNTFGTHPIGAVLQKSADTADEAFEGTVKGGQVVYEHVDPTGLKTTKTFSLPQLPESGKKATADEYTVKLDVSFSNTGSVAVEYPDYLIYVGSAEPIRQRDQPIYTNFAWYTDKITLIDPNWFAPHRMAVVGIETAPGQSNYLQSPGGIVWAGVKDQYFATLLSLTGTTAQSVWASPLEIKTDTKTVKGIQGALGMPSFRLNPGATRTEQFTLYAGPKEYRRLKELGQGQAEIMNFGMFKIISIFLLRIMNLLHDYIGSYAIAIIVLTFVVRGALWPIQGAATRSMKRMQLLQPRMAELKEKYKDDPTRMNTEVMKLYKDYKINPFGGCLPMFIQIPIFFGFYSMLGTAVELRNSQFLWVHDLSQPDTIFHLGGIAVNILPLCMAGTMLWQMSLTPKTGDAAQQKMFMFMPLVFVYFTYNFASALALYYTVQNTLSIIQLYATRNQEPPTLEKVPAPSSKRSNKTGRGL